MNFYYIDPSQKSNGAGTISSPFNSIQNLVSFGINHPCSILLKCGTTTCESVDFGTLLENTDSANPSYITSYGTGRKPHWVRATHDNPNISGSRVRNLYLWNVRFYTNSNDYGPVASGTMIDFQLPNDGASDLDANVWVEDCALTGSAFNRSAWKGGGRSIYIRVRSDAKGRVNKFGVRRTPLINLSRGIQLTGNDKADDLTTNVTGTYYSRGVKVEDCEMIGMSQGAVVISSCESLNDAYTDDEYQSVIRRCSYSSFRWDHYDGQTLQVDAGFWTYHCNRVMIEHIYGGGMQAINADSELIDFDGLSWDCVARYIVGFSSVCAGLFTSSESHARAKYSDYSSSYTLDQWYYDRRNGSGNNVIECSYFYNCGVQRTFSGVLGNLPGEIFRCLGYQYNNTIRKTLFIDNVSYNNVKIATSEISNKPANGLNSMTWDSCAFIFKFYADTSLMDLSLDYKFINCLINSDVWTADDQAAAASDLSSKATASGTIFTSPLLSFVPVQPPVSIDAAKKIRVQKSSPLISGGSSSSGVDINGNSGNSIGWIEL